MTEVDRLTVVLKTRFPDVQVREDYGWPCNSALSVLDCVLSLRRSYDRVVYPSVVAFAERRPDLVELEHLDTLMSGYDELGDFCRNELNYNDPHRERTLRGVVRHLLTVQHEHVGDTEHERLCRWAAFVHPGDYALVGVKGFGLAGFQYLRMLFGVQTTKPAVHIMRFVSQAVGRPVNDLTALVLLEQAARQADLPLRELDGVIWEAGARAAV